MKKYTMEDFKTKKIAVTLETQFQWSVFTQELDKAGIRHPSGKKATEWYVFKNPYRGGRFAISAHNGLGYCYDKWFLDEGYTVVPFSSFAFSRPSPTYELHIACADGKLTHAVYKENGKLVRRATATRNDLDAFDFKAGAYLAMMRALGVEPKREKDEQPKPDKPAEPTPPARPCALEACCGRFGAGREAR